MGVSATTRRMSSNMSVNTDAHGRPLPAVAGYFYLQFHR